MRLPAAFAVIVAVLSAANACGAQELRRDVVYAKHGDRELKLDLALPTGDARMRPAMLCIHGGGWRGGNKAGYHNQIRKLAAQGFVAATAEYRLSGDAVWPAQLDDVRAAFDWLVSHAEELRLDPERIGVMGGSAGGHLSLMLAITSDEAGRSVRPRAVFNYFGPTEFRDVEKIKHGRTMVEGLIGGRLEESAQKLADISPVRFVSRADPPVLTFQGTADQVVPPEQAEILHGALAKAQIPNQLFAMEGVGHTIGGDLKILQDTQAAFAAAYLRGGDMPLVASEDFDSGLSRWQPTDAAAWTAAKQRGRTFASLTKRKSDYTPKVRSPFNILLLKDISVGDFILDVDARSTNEVYGHQDLCLFFGYQDPSHFYYVHLGRKADAHANSVFLVNDEPRVSIAQKRTDGTDWSKGWHRIRIKRDVKAGRIEVYFDDMTKPIMSTVDKTFGAGQIGVGSFDDTGDFDAVRLWGRQP